MAVSKTCTKCGKDTTENFEYCGFCGAPLEYIDPQQREPFAGFRLLSNMTGIVRLSQKTYRNIANDSSLLIQSFFVVAFAAVAQGFSSHAKLTHLPLVVAEFVMLWLSWLLLIYVFSILFYPRSTVPKQAWMSFLCVGGFAQSPAIFYILFVPLYWFGFSGQTFLYAISIVIMLLQFAAMILATRSVFVLQALWKTIIIVAVSYIPFIVGQWIISRVEIG